VSPSLYGVVKQRIRCTVNLYNDLPDLTRIPMIGSNTKYGMSTTQDGSSKIVKEYGTVAEQDTSVSNVTEYEVRIRLYRDNSTVKSSTTTGGEGKSSYSNSVSAIESSSAYWDYDVDGKGYYKDGTMSYDTKFGGPPRLWPLLNAKYSE
jgi:hypothetical protein